MSLQQRFTTFSLVATITLLAVVACNLLLYGVILVRHGLRGREPMVLPGPVAKYGLEKLAAPGVYQGYAPEEILALLTETYQPLTFEPYTLYRETPRAGTYVNVSEHGFRLVADQAPYPPPVDGYNVFVFGGSTTFGYGVADKETIASHLQQALRERMPEANVYNFGRGFYYSTQERILFELLLTRGVDMDAAVFIDGVNEKAAVDSPSLAADLERGFALAQQDPEERTSTPALLGLLLKRTPMGRLALYFQAGGNRAAVDDEAREPELGRDQAAELGRQIAERYLDSARMIRAVSAAFGVEPLFVWQPANWLDYGQEHHVFAYMDPEAEFAQKYAYRSMRTHMAAGHGPDMLDLSAMQKGEQRPLYVDGVHYNDFMNQQIALRIADALLARAGRGAE